MILERDYHATRPGRLLSFEMFSGGAGPLLAVQGPFGFPYVIDTIVALGAASVGQPLSLNLFVSDDNDATQTTTPTGDKVYEWRGSVQAGDQLLPTWKSDYPATLHPRFRVTRTPTYLKAMFRTGTTDMHIMLVHIIPLVPLL